MYGIHIGRWAVVRKRDVLAGALLLNTVPHTIMGLAGKRLLTPLGGPNSAPAVNLVWAGLNAAGAVAALAPGGWRSIAQPAAEERLRAVHLGAFAMAAFGVVYELTPSAARRRTLRATQWRR
jgi:hypothetical protein